MFRIPLLLSLLLAGCATDGKQQVSAISENSTDTHTAEIQRATKFIQDGLPFPVDIDPRGILFESSSSDPELGNLKRSFLQPLARSPHAGKIKKVRIDAAELEWYQWECRIYVEDLTPIEITHFAGFWSGKSSDDPDAYRPALQYILSQLDNIAQRVGW